MFISDNYLIPEFDIGIGVAGMILEWFGVPLKSNQYARKLRRCVFVIYYVKFELEGLLYT